MKRLLMVVPFVAAMTASAEYQYIIDSGVRPAKPTPVVSSGTLAASDVVGATSGVTAPGGASWLYARWCEFTDYIRVRRDRFAGFIFSLR